MCAGKASRRAQGGGPGQSLPDSCSAPLVNGLQPAGGARLQTCLSWGCSGTRSPTTCMPCTATPSLNRPPPPTPSHPAQHMHSGVPSGGSAKRPQHRNPTPRRHVQRERVCAGCLTRCQVHLASVGVGQGAAQQAQRGLLATVRVLHVQVRHPHVELLALFPAGRSGASCVALKFSPSCLQAGAARGVWHAAVWHAGRGSLGSLGFHCAERLGCNGAAAAPSDMAPWPTRQGLPDCCPSSQQELPSKRLL